MKKSKRSHWFFFFLSFLGNNWASFHWSDVIWLWSFGNMIFYYYYYLEADFLFLFLFLFLFFFSLQGSTWIWKAVFRESWRSMTGWSYTLSKPKEVWQVALVVVVFLLMEGSRKKRFFLRNSSLLLLLFFSHKASSLFFNLTLSLGRWSDCDCNYIFNWSSDDLCVMIILFVLFSHVGTFSFILNHK